MEICAKLFGPKLVLRDAASGTLRGPHLLRACSAFAGDYEDPDRTAWVTDGGEVEDAGAPQAECEEFPAES